MKHPKYSAVMILSFGLLCGSTFAADTQNTISPTTAETKMSLSKEVIKNLDEGNAFLSMNKTKEGVVTLPSGLQYKIIKAGDGAKPVDGDSVTVNYAGTFIDGSEFDSSYKSGQPISFPVNGVISGWTEALKLMTVGSIWELYIPANLAYGKYGMPPVIGQNKTLIFKVELLGINK